jgi:hypothetical protein
MKTILAVAAVATAFAAGSAAAATTPSALPAPVETPPAVGSVFADLAAFGYDLGKFRPDYGGRFPYRRA